MSAIPCTPVSSPYTIRVLIVSLLPLAAPYVGCLALLVTRILNRDLSDLRLTHPVLAGGFTAGLIPSRNGEPHEAGSVSSVDFGETT